MPALPLLAIVFFAFVAETITGFGATIITVTLGAHFYSIPELLPIFVPVSLLLSALIVLFSFEAVEWRLLLRRILPWALLGLFGGIALSSALGEGRALRLLFALFVILLSAVELLRIRRGVTKAGPLPPAAGAAWLFAGGVVHGLFATGGPLVVYFLSREVEEKRRFRSTVSALWVLLNSALVFRYAERGRLDLQSLQASAYLLLPLAAGLALGEWAHRRADPGAFRGLVFGLLLIAGLSLLASALG